MNCLFLNFAISSPERQKMINRIENEIFYRTEYRLYYYLKHLILIVQAAGLQVLVMVKSKPAFMLPVKRNQLLLQVDNIQGKVVICHDPQRIGMGMGGKKVS